jgi:diadenosine tetraphosphate (Ap4A) HIT family hydrolase
MRKQAMLPVLNAGFVLHQQLEADTEPVLWLGLCELRVMNDRRWPWLVLVPQRPGIEEIHDLTPLDQAMLIFESNMVAQSLKRLTGCNKINTGALGNVVRQLHFHIVARFEGDAGWPGPVWGYGEREPYRRTALHQFAERVRDSL